MDCRAAKECLLTRGVPMTTVYRAPVNDVDAGASIAEVFKPFLSVLLRAESLSEFISK